MQVVCAVCKSGVSEDSNDILICDFSKCNRAYHQVSHPVKGLGFNSPQGLAPDSRLPTPETAIATQP